MDKIAVIWFGVQTLMAIIDGRDKVMKLRLGGEGEIYVRTKTE